MAAQSGAAPRQRTLVLLRHAKADRPNGVADMDRPLTDRGHADAAAAGGWLVHHGHLPDLVLCSPSRRTRQTWHSVAIALAGACSPEVRYERAIYDGSVEDLNKLVQELGESVHTVLLIGHNPTVSALSTTLDERAAADSDGLRTSGIAVHRSPQPWPQWTQAQVSALYTARA